MSSRRLFDGAQQEIGSLPIVGASGVTFAGAVIAVTASLIAGSFTGGATFNGQTITATASVIAGSMSAGASATFNGQTLTATASVIPGTATGAASYSGQTVTATASLIKGTMSGGGGGGADPAAVWAYELLPGVSAGAMLTAIYQSLPTAADAVVTAMNANPPDVNVKKVNGYTVDGSGTQADPWGPA